MAKYIIDIDSFKDCLDFAAFTKVNGQPVAFINDIKDFIDKFPKEPLDFDMSETMCTGETE